MPEVIGKDESVYKTEDDNYRADRANSRTC